MPQTTRQSVFESLDYKPYLRFRLSPEGPSRGLRSRLAEHLRCQPAYVSQVLGGTLHFSLEQIPAVAEFLELSPEEEHFLLLQVSFARAGTPKLEAYYRRQLEEILQAREQIQNRITENTAVSLEAQLEYYSSWQYAAVHIALSVPELQTPQALSRELKLPLQQIQKLLSFLVRNGFAQEEKGHYKIGPRRTHLASDSPMITKHHTNWRLRALEALDQSQKENLHYSAVFSLSVEDAAKIRSLLLESLERADELLMKSPEKVLCGLAIDWFRLT